MWKRLVLPVCITTLTLLLAFSTYFYINYTYFAVPVLNLKGSKEISINLNADYTEPGYEAKKGEESLNSKVKVSNNINNEKIGTYEVKYSIKNRAGNKRRIETRKVVVVDREEPVISLIGDVVNIYKGKDYVEPGYSAIDNYDGDITNKVVVTNNIDKNTLGTYYVNYEVSDSSSNKTIIERKINVIDYPKPVISIGIPVLMYHFFYDGSTGEKGKDNNWMEVSKFDEQMKYLKDNNYYFPSWDELEQYIDGKITLPDKSIIVTADDGNDTFFRLAYPVLQKYGIKATSFVITSWTNLNNYNIDRNIIDLESHSNNMHRGGCSGGLSGIFPCIGYNEGYEDLMTSINIVGSKEIFCYPFGSYSDSAIKLLKDTGFKLAVTTKPGKVRVGMNKLLLPRIRIQGYYNLENFIYSITYG